MPKTIHGLRKRVNGKTKEYISWDRMKQRCHNPKDVSYYKYGAKGIEVCDRWRNSFTAFLKDMGTAPSPNHTIDRFPNKTGNYEPGNCRWATPIEQQRNRTNNRIIKAFGSEKTLSEWAEYSGIPKQTISGRLKAGWPINTAVTFKGY